MNKLRSLFFAALALLFSSSLALAQVGNFETPADQEIIQSLIGTTWSGTAFDQTFDFYFLADRVLVYRTKGVVYNKSKWHVRNQKVEINLHDNPQFRLEAIFSGTLNKDTITGTAKNILSISSGLVGPREYGPIFETEDSPWLLDKVDTPIVELIKATPKK